MNLGEHAGFIVAAYTAVLIVIAALIAWIVADYRAQRRALDAFGPRARADEPGL